ncbi:aspartate kinase [Lentilactobacillus parabuchneri]|nr:aspartate kinase [Lentilactobacillus parabuchneri]APR07602.1 Aspartokinase 3 [Lentilactobacillus parabuchneri]MBW0222920.1 aspartate kinase [Lentilactobacillus parabuchneri]MBW0245976.1 aspartate kinase [Lentilactobacillus parabuchneri]MBW0264052.1 aspartate kinase [Lentilactobacillus parabuchneri]MCT2884783.1 aspartate kinase [Lentilactobacillus parabuchneri]
MKVVKFGGSSLADAAHVQKVINIVQSDPDRKVVVTSAPGKRFSGDVKVTDLLIQYANAIIAGTDATQICETIFARYQEIGNGFGVPATILDDIKQKLIALPTKSYPNDDYLMAAFKAHGERLNAELFAACLNESGENARFVDPSEAGILLSDDPNGATVLEKTYDNLAHLTYGDEKLVFPGFFGFSEDGNIVTFARGGSDITGSILAAGLHASLYENFTDVDAIFAANPKVVNDPLPIHKMTFREMRELSYAGFSVFNDEAIIPAIQGQVPINVKNTNNPDLPGTLIVPEEDFTSKRPVTGIAGSNRFAALYLHRYLLNKEVGFTLKILQILYKYGVSYEHMPSGIDDLTIIFDRTQLDRDTIKKMCRDIQSELHPDTLDWIDDYAIIMVVGEGMRARVGTIENIIRPLAEHNIPVHMINQGASRISIMLGTRQSDADAAVKYIYEHFFRENPSVNRIEYQAEV